MNKTLLINRINPQDFTRHKKKMFFLIGEINVPAKEAKLIDVLNNSNLLEINDIVYKYNGVELNIEVQTIPEVVKLLARESFLIYSIFEIYNPV